METNKNNKETSDTARGINITLCHNHHSPHFTDEETERQRLSYTSHGMWVELVRSRSCQEEVSCSIDHVSFQAPLAFPIMDGFGRQIHCDIFLLWCSGGLEHLIRQIPAQESVPHLPGQDPRIMIICLENMGWSLSLCGLERISLLMCTFLNAALGILVLTKNDACHVSKQRMLQSEGKPSGNSGWRQNAHHQASLMLLNTGPTLNNWGVYQRILYQLS